MCSYYMLTKLTFLPLKRNFPLTISKEYLSIASNLSIQTAYYQSMHDHINRTNRLAVNQLSISVHLVSYEVRIYN